MSVPQSQAGETDLGTAVIRPEGTVHSEVDGDVLMMNAQTGAYHSLSGVGARIWSLLKEPASAAEICDRLLTEYRVDRQRCESEVLAFVRQLAAQGVVAPAAAGPNQPGER